MSLDFVPTPEELAGAQKQLPDSFVDIPDGKGGKQPLTFAVRANTSSVHRERHVAVNIERNIPRFLNRTDLMALRNEPIAIVGGGPSAKRHLDDIRKFKYVMAAGSSHDFLVENGIVPSFAVSTDSKPETSLYFQNPQKGCAYLIASTVPPALFDWLKDYDVQLWHFNEQVDQEHYRGEQSIGWGCMVGVVCIQIALWLGFQQQHYFGYDCSLEPGATHSYAVSQEESDDIWKASTWATMGEGVNQTKFLTTTALICQMMHFYGIYRSPDGKFLKGYVYGKGMLWDNIRQSPPEMKHWLEAV